MRILAGVVLVLAALVPLAALTVRRRGGAGQGRRGPTVADGLLVLALFVLAVLVVAIVSDR
ncbi:MAG: hypothetical protein U0R50_05865 [Gaiellales bacterium]